jgi:hypothetical protein
MRPDATPCANSDNHDPKISRPSRIIIRGLRLRGRVSNGRALGPGGQRLNALDAAVRHEVLALAEGVDPQVLDHLQRQWREQGLVPPADAAEMLAAYARELHDRGVPAVAADQVTAAARRAAAGEAAEASHLAGYAGQEHGTANQSAGMPDVAATAVDEHRAGLDRSNTTDGWHVTKRSPILWVWMSTGCSRRSPIRPADSCSICSSRVTVAR